jgi:flagellin
MGLRVSTNIAAINAQRNLGTSTANIQDSLAKLSSGSRINKAADDAAGLAISENMKAGIRSTRQANRNANDGISMVQTAEGGLNEIGNIITRMRELGIQASSDTVGETERGFIDKEIQQLKSESQRISEVTTWGKTKLLDGTTPNFDFQVGIFNNESEDRISFNAAENNATLDTLGLAGLDYHTKEGAQSALEALDKAQESVNGMRSNLGALQNRLMSTVNNLGVAEENMSAANSRIRDTDVAATSAELTRNNIMLQASVSALAQANTSNQVALNLVRS